MQSLHRSSKCGSRRRCTSVKYIYHACRSVQLTKLSTLRWNVRPLSLLLSDVFTLDNIEHYSCALNGIVLPRGFFKIASVYLQLWPPTWISHFRLGQQFLQPLPLETQKHSLAVENVVPILSASASLGICV